MVSNPYYQFSMCFQRLYPYAIFRLRQKEHSNEVHKVAYLTFDDGPIPEVTPRVLDILKQYGVKATFFMVGENIDKYPDLYRRVIAEGHAVGNHTYHHVKGMKMSTAKYLEEVIKWEQTVEQHGAPSTRLFDLLTAVHGGGNEKPSHNADTKYTYGMCSPMTIVHANRPRK